jgi:hypothetical protein
MPARYVLCCTPFYGVVGKQNRRFVQIYAGLDEWVTYFFLTRPTGQIRSTRECIDKKENTIFLIYKEIQNGAVAKSYMANGLRIYGEIFAHFLIY